MRWPPAGYNANNQNTALGYDASGDVINDGQHQYLYDAEGRVCAVQYQVLTGGPVSMVGYIYDAEGSGVAKGTISAWNCDPTSNGFQETAGYVLGPNGEQVTEVDGGGNWQHTNVFAAGQLIATYNPDGCTSICRTGWAPAASIPTTPATRLAPIRLCPSEN